MAVENEHENEMQYAVSVSEINEAILNLAERMSQLPPHHRINVDTDPITSIIPANVHRENETIRDLGERISQLPIYDRAVVETLPITTVLPENVCKDLTQMMQGNFRQITERGLDNLMYNVGLALKDEMWEDIMALRSLYQSPDDLSTINPATYILDRSKCLTLLLNGISPVKMDKMKDKDLFMFARTIEQVYHMRFRKAILPFSFISSMVQFYTSGSKTVSVLNGKLSPGGSYFTISEWMAKQGKDPLCAPPGDVETLFDNAGRYHLKTYRVSAADYKKSTIFTTGIHIAFNDNLDLQKRADLKPSLWGASLTEIEIQAKMYDVIRSSENKFSFVRASFIDVMLQDVLNEGDEVDLDMAAITRKFHRFCTNIDCRKEFYILKFKCDKCGSKVEKPVTDTTETRNEGKAEYRFLPDVTNFKNNPVITMADPIFVNPNSYDTVEICFDRYYIALGIGVDREWSFLGCDGPPHVIGSRTIDANPTKYDWIAMSNGLGHLYMNQMKTLFNILRPIFLEDLAKDVLHFQSGEAIKKFFRCSDTHKTFQSLEVLLYGTVKEMLYLYVKESGDSSPSVHGFFEWSPNETFHMLRQLILNFALAILVNKIGDRANNPEYQSAGRYKFLSLFYAFDHPIYQEIEYRDLRQKVTMPEEVRRQREQNLTYAQSSQPMKHQGGDFILENKVKRQKMLASKGDVTPSMWQQISRSLDDIVQVSEFANSRLNIHDVDGIRDTNMTLEITRWRSLLRHTNYLMKHSDTPLPYSIDGEVLSRDMTNLTQIARGKMEEYYSIMKTQKHVTRGSIPTVSVMPNYDLDDLLFDGIEDTLDD